MKFENKISKKSNLIENDSLSIYNNWAAQQNWNAFEVFHNFLEKVKPKRIFQFGIKSILSSNKDKYKSGKFGMTSKNLLVLFKQS